MERLILSITWELILVTMMLVAKGYNLVNAGEHEAEDNAYVEDGNKKCDDDDDEGDDDDDDEEEEEQEDDDDGDSDNGIMTATQRGTNL